MVTVLKDGRKEALQCWSLLCVSVYVNSIYDYTVFIYYLMKVHRCSTSSHIIRNYLILIKIGIYITIRGK